MHCNVALTFIVDQPHSLEFIHEEIDSRTGRTNNFGKGFLAHSGNLCIRQPIESADTRKLQKHARQPFLAVIEQLIAEIFFETDIARQ